VCVLALGIGANTAIFSVVDGVVLHPLPYPDPERLVRLFETVNSVSMASSHMEVAPANFLDWQAQATSFSGMAAYYSDKLPLSADGNAVVIPSAGVSHNLFAVLEVTPVLGRAFTTEEDSPFESAPVVILSYELWQARFGGEVDVLGRRISLDGSNYTVVGVMPRSFSFPAGTQLWTPLALNERQLKMREARFLNVIGRVRADVSVSAARAEVEAITGRLASAYPVTNQNWGINVVQLLDEEVGKVRPALVLLFGTVGLVLLIACANIANLQVAKAVARRSEIAVRVALGASRWRIARQLLTESVMLSVFGGLFGCFLAWWVLDGLIALAPEQLPRADQIRLNLPVLGFAAIASIFTGIVCGCLPAIHASRVDLVTMLKEGTERVGGTAARNRLLGSLVVGEIALALIVLSGAGLLIRSFIHLNRVDSGLDVDNVLTVRLTAPSARYNDPNRWRENRLRFYDLLIPRLEALPGVESVAAVDSLPLSGASRVYRFRNEGQPDSSSNPAATYEVATTRFFRAVGMRAVFGRLFTDEDREGSLPVVVINETMARRFWPQGNAIGSRIFIRNDKTPREIVGIVNDVKHFGLDRETAPAMYVPYNQAVIDVMPMVIRTNGDPARIAGAVREQVAAVDPDVAISRIETMRDIESASMAERRFTMVLLAVFGGVALVLAAMGIYGVVGYSVAQRTREFGIRFALGAQSRDVLRLVVARGMKLAIAGVAIGLAGAFVLTKSISAWLGGLLFGVRPTDSVTLGSIGALLVLVTLIACWLPARLASKVDPIVAMRHD
jgi:putative ABC transport system permease protein